MSQVAAVLPPPALVVRLVEEIILIVCRCKVILSSGLASERFTVADLLKIVQPAGDTLIAVAVEGVQVDTGSAVNAGVDFGAFKDRLSVCIHDAGSRCAVGVDEVAVLVSLIIRSFQVTVTERCLDGGEGRNGLAIALQLALTFLIRCLNGCLDLCNRSGIRLTLCSLEKIPMVFQDTHIAEEQQISFAWM